MEVDFIENRIDFRVAAFLALKLKGQSDILSNREVRKDVIFLKDETHISVAIRIEFGLGEILAGFAHAWTSDAAASVDNTHLNLYGAQVISYLFATALSKSAIPLKDYLKTDFAFPDEATYRVSNPSYVHPTYTAPTAGSTFYKTTAPYWGSVFGDVGGASKVNDTTKFGITENSDGSVTLLANGAGKISAKAGDGIVFYGLQIAKDKNFTFKAKATLLTTTSNNQVSFGLMIKIIFL